MAEATSAIGNASHTRFKLPLSDNRYALGNSTTTCLTSELIKLYVPFPIAWNTEPKMIQYPATGKCVAIILKAGAPIAINSSDALNKLNNVCGINSKAIVPSDIIPTASNIENLITSIILYFFLAP